MNGEFVRRRADGWALVVGLAIVTLCALPASSGAVSSSERRAFEAINGLPDALQPIMSAAQFLGVLAVGPVVALVALGLRRYRLALAAALITVGKLACERIVWQVSNANGPA